MVNLWATRSILCVPGHDPKKIKLALDSQADLILFDLEDSVPEHQYSLAREIVTDCVTLGGNRKTAVRVRNMHDAIFFNGLCDVLFFPKVETLVPDMVLPRVGTRWVAFIETANGLRRVDEIAQTMFDALILGYYDLVASARYWHGSWHPFLELARNQTLLACANADIPFFDGVFPGRQRVPGPVGELVLNPKDIVVANSFYAVNRDAYRKAINRWEQSAEPVFMDGDTMSCPPRALAMKNRLQKVSDNDNE